MEAFADFLRHLVDHYGPQTSRYSPKRIYVSVEPVLPPFRRSSQPITLPAELVALTERLAENAHDLWALQRLKDGCQVKTLLTGPEIPVASDVAVPWDIAYFIEFLKPKLGE